MRVGRSDFVVYTKRIWYKLMFNGHMWVFVEKALSFWAAWKQAQSSKVPSRLVQNDRVAWIPPRNGQWKLNIDAAVFGDAGCGLGMVVRDYQGKVERMGVQQVRDKWCPEVAEAMAAEFGLLTAKQMGLDNVVLESDCLTLITMLKSKSFPNNYFGRAGKKVSDLASSFSCISFNFTRRDGNVVAHELAHLVPLEFSTRYWVGAIPERVEPFVLVDSLAISN
ncbi:uncharacterized protein LOC141639748 [Silene latifolia]|uniref:uncharacterized protein LOC141639748 n=1 Tax=Silene latifolia TaxID=37657 RepID=UPI003D776914